MAIDLLNLLKRAAAGEDRAIEEILTLFKEEKITTAEQEQIHTYSKQAARQSHFAIYLRALFFDYGYGVKKDPESAFLLHREAASKGNAKATFEVGRHFLEGFGVEKNYESALQWLRISAGSPNYVPEAMFELGQMYELGLGVEVDEGSARSWYEKAAQKGHEGARGKLNLGG